MRQVEARAEAAARQARRLAGRLDAAEDALADEIAQRSGVSSSGARILARLRIDELAGERCAVGEAELAAHGSASPCCSRCWGLLQPGGKGAGLHVRAADVFEPCAFCGGLTSGSGDLDRAWGRDRRSSSEEAKA